jgi:hypothetical protein
MSSREARARTARDRRTAKARAAADVPDRSNARPPYQRLLLAMLGIAVAFVGALMVFYFLSAVEII